MNRLLVFGLLAIISFATNTGSTNLVAQIHPKKQIFRDVAKWPTTTPNKISLKNFTPFRAVYDRTYRQHAGPNTGDIRKDRVIISAEEISWDGKRSIAISLIDSGVVGKSDTTARTLSMIVHRRNLSVLFEIGPIPGTAKDYYIHRIEKGNAYQSKITTDTQQIRRDNKKYNKPGFGPSAWALASSGLRKGKKIKLTKPYSPTANPLTETYAGHILETKTITDGSGKQHKAWVLETTKSFTSSKVKHLYLIDKPPYYLGTETVDLDTGERKKFIWLRHTENLKNE